MKKSLFLFAVYGVSTIAFAGSQLPLSFTLAPNNPLSVAPGSIAELKYTVKNNTKISLPLSVSQGMRASHEGTLVFDESSESNTCGSTLAAEQACDLIFKYTAPQSPGETRGYVRINYQGRQALISYLSFTVSGTLDFSPTALNLKQGVAGDSITVTNQSLDVITGLQFTNGYQDALAGKFESTCASDLASGQSCSLTINEASVVPERANDFVVKAMFKINGAAYGSLLGVSSPIAQAYNLWCWGWNGHHQLGDGTTSSRYVPVAVQQQNSGTVKWVEVSSGDAHNCALSEVGTAYCWGKNSKGQSGQSDTSVDVNVPNAVSTDTALVALSSGYLHTCALSGAGSGFVGRVYCWGSNQYGQLGNGVSGAGSYSSSPVTVMDENNDPIENVVMIASGNYHSCALLNTGQVRCWGYNNYGQLGNNTKTNSSKSVTVVANTDGDPLEHVVSIAAGSYHNCALLATGEVRCWGSNGYGQLGDDTSVDRSIPVKVNISSDAASSETVAAIALGQRHSCALIPGQGVQCWGSNSDGQLGDGTTTDRSTPGAVSNIGADVVSIKTGSFATCALLTGGTAKCWGNNDNGRLGIGTAGGSEPLPKEVLQVSGGAAFEGIYSISVGGAHACAISKTEPSLP